MKLTEDQQRDRYERRVGWHDGIPEGHYAIPDPHSPATVSCWRVKTGRLTPWPKQARTGPRLLRRDVPAYDPERRAVLDAWGAERRSYMEQVAAMLRRDPEQSAARYAAVTFRCANCNRALTVPESNGYGIGPECRRWMPDDLLAEYARQVSIIRAVQIGGAP